MASIKDIEERIVSVKKTSKITQAMKMVAAAKFKRYLVQLNNVKECDELFEVVMQSLSSRLFNDDLPDLLQQNESPQVAFIVLSSDKGLCGGFNSNLFKKINQEMGNHQQVDLYLVGNKAQQFYKSLDVKVVESRSGFKPLEEPEALTHYIEGIIQSYKNGVYSKVFVIYNEFVSALSANQVVQQLLPVKLENWDPNVTTKADFIYEPSKMSVLNKLLSRYVDYNFLRAVHESMASEEGFRMAAMDSASNNAKDMIQELTLFFNRSRQAAITTELTEIVAGAASIS